MEFVAIGRDDQREIRMMFLSENERHKAPRKPKDRA